MLRHVPYFNFNMGYLASRGAIPNAFQQMQLEFYYVLCEHTRVCTMFYMLSVISMCVICMCRAKPVSHCEWRGQPGRQNADNALLVSVTRN